MIQISFGQVLEVSMKMQMNGWLIRFQSRTIIFQINYRKDFKALPLSASLLSKFTTQVFFSMLIISMDLKLCKLKLETNRINTIINQKYILLIKIPLKNKFLILLRSCNQVDISKSICWESLTSNQWITSFTSPWATLELKVFRLKICNLTKQFWLHKTPKKKKKTVAQVLKKLTVLSTKDSKV